MKLADLLKGVDVKEQNAGGGLEISGMSVDSRKVKPGGAFIAHVGAKDDGHKYIEQALANGAAVLVLGYKPERLDEGAPYIIVGSTRAAEAKMWAAWYRNPARDIKIIGITGTNGKTSTTYLLKEILDGAGYKTALFGTIKSIINGREFESKLTTGDPDELARLFALARDEGVQYAVMEVSSHALELEKTAGLGGFDVGIFLNLTQDHLDFHGTMENYGQAKAKLFKQSRIGIFNADDEASWVMLKGASVIEKYFYGKAKHADFYADNIEYLGADGLEYDFCVGGASFGEAARSFRIKSPLVAEFYVYNTMAAAACALILGIGEPEIMRALGKVKVKGRMERVEIDAPYAVFIDYAHTPDALESVLKSVRGFIGQGRIISVFGCGGDRDKLKRPEMGKAAAEHSDICVITSDNSRSEEPEDIIKDIIAGIDQGEYHAIADRREAIRYAMSIARAGDIVLLAGKGHEEYMEEKGEVKYFSEREIVYEFKNRGGS